MATPIYVPSPIAALPRVRIYPPQNNTATVALSGALSAITDVAQNWRQKQQAVQQAKGMADALEREGLTQEANLYRAAADNYSINFFASPQENQKFNSGLISDTLKLLESKQNRELREKQIEAMAQSRADMLRFRAADDLRADARLQFEKEALGARLEESKEVREARTEAKNQSLSISEENAARLQLSEVQDQKKAAMAQRDSGQLSQEQFANIFGPLQDQELQLKHRISDTLIKRGIQAPKPVRGGIPELKTKAERTVEMNRESAAKAMELFRNSPTAAEWKDPETGIVHQNPRMVRTTGTDAEGRPIDRTIITAPGGSPIKTTPLTDPALDGILNLE